LSIFLQIRKRSSLVLPSSIMFMVNSGNTKGGKYHCTIDLLFDWFGLVCFANNNKIVSCQTADYKTVKQEGNDSDTSPFSIPCPTIGRLLSLLKQLIRKNNFPSTTLF